jgi:tape measure domain-containing protein
MDGVSNIIGNSIGKSLNKESSLSLLTATLKNNSIAAQKLYGEIQQIANVSPFDTASILKATQAFLNAGDTAEQAKKKVKDLMNAAASADNPNQSLIELSQIRSKNDPAGRWMTEDLNQMQDRGIPIYKQLAETMNTTVAAVRKLASEGKITSEVMQSAFDTMNAKGGVLNGRMEALSKTTKGLQSTMQDTFDNIMTEGGEAFAPAMRAGVEFLTEVAEELKNSGMFTELLAASTEFAAYLTEHKELVGQVANTIKVGVTEGLKNVIAFSKTLLGFVQQIGSKESGFGYWVSTLGPIVELLGTVLKVIAKIAEGVNLFVTGLIKAAEVLANLVYLGSFQGNPEGVDPTAKYDNVSEQMTDIAARSGIKNKFTIAAMLGTIQQESNFDPNAREPNGNGRGLFQHDVRDRAKGVVNMDANGNPIGNTVAEQLPKAIREIIADYKAATGRSFLDDANNAKSLDEAMAIWKATIRYGEVGNRKFYAQQLLGTVNNRLIAGTTMGPQPQSTGREYNVKKSSEIGKPTLSGTVDASGQNGGDFGVGPNGELDSKVTGVVTEIGNAGNNGNYVVVAFKHNGKIYEQTTSHGRATVKKGDNVVAGQVIAMYDGSGRSTGPHNSVDINSPGTGGALQRSQESAEARAIAEGIVKGKTYGSGGISNVTSPTTNAKIVNDTADKERAAAEAEKKRLKALEIANKEQKAAWDRQDAETKAARAKRDAAIDIEDKDLKTQYMNELALLDKKADINIQLKRAQETLAADTKENPENKKINADKYKEIQASTQTELTNLQAQIDATTAEINKKLELQRVEAEKYALSLKLRKEEFAEAQNVEAETDVIKKAAATFKQQMTVINNKYQQEQSDIEKRISDTQKLIDEYKKLGKKSDELEKTRDALTNAKDQSLTQQGLELGGAAKARNKTQRDRIDELSGGINSSLDSSMDAYNQRTMSTDQYNAYKRGQGQSAIINRSNRERQNIASIKDIDPAKYEQMLSAINRLEQVDISNLNNQFKTLGQTITESVVRGLGDAFSSIIDGTQTAGQAMLGFLKNIAKQLLDMAMNQLITGLLGKLFGGLGGGLGGVGAATKIGGAVGGSIKIPGFATGGLVSSPTIAMIGEGAYNEAVVPLPNGSHIPVQLSGGGGGVTSNVTVNVSNSGQVSSSGANGLSREIEAAVRNVIVREQRPGGVLRQTRR